MQDTNNEKLHRRATDLLAQRVQDRSQDTACITNEYASIMHDEIEAIKRKIVLIDTAFLRDDLSGVDYTSHRKDHLDRQKTKAIITEYKISSTKVLLGIIVTFVLGLLASGFLLKVAEQIK